MSEELTWPDFLLGCMQTLSVMSCLYWSLNLCCFSHMSSHCSRSNHNQHSHELFTAPTMNGWCVLAVWSFHHIQHRLYCTSTNIDNLPSFTGSTLKRLTGKLVMMNDWTVRPSKDWKHCRAVAADLNRIVTMVKNWMVTSYLNRKYNHQ